MPRRLLILLALVVALPACSFSFSVGGLDYEELETAIGAELDSSYASIDRTVSAVSCPELAENPEPGDTLICTADLDGEDVRVEVLVEDEDYNVTFNTLDIVYDLPDTAAALADDISTQLGFAVNLNCGEGIVSIAIGDSFNCTAVDATNTSATVAVTANGAGDTSWEILE